MGGGSPDGGMVGGDVGVGFTCDNNSPSAACATVLVGEFSRATLLTGAEGT